MIFKNLVLQALGTIKFRFLQKKSKTNFHACVPLSSKAKKPEHKSLEHKNLEHKKLEHKRGSTDAGAQEVEHKSFSTGSWSTLSESTKTNTTGGPVQGCCAKAEIGRVKYMYRVV
jgi:hypothetical protein